MQRRKEKEKEKEKEKPVSNNSALGIAVGAAIIGVAGFVAGSLATYFATKSSEEIAIPQETQNKGLSTNLNKVSHEEVVEITKNFSKMIGHGGYGTVYKGTWKANKVAVKCLDGDSMQGFNEFKKEIEILSKYRSPYVVSLMAYSCGPRWGPPYHLIYEYAENGNLEKCIDEGKLKQLNHIFDISVHIAKGMLFIQEAGSESIVHFDLKSANILLDSNWNAKIADFGLVEKMDKTNLKKTSQAEGDLKGTFIYTCPQYLDKGYFSEKTDVYGYGIILTEVLLGKVANTKTREFFNSPKEAIYNSSLFPWSENLQNFELLYQVAMKCLDYESTKRPSFSEIVQYLEPNPN